MPIYEYRCTECFAITEKIQKFSDEPLTECEKCLNKFSLEKVISNTSFVLKGDGWYKDGYATVKKKKE